jgi:hypothetical protein
MLYTKLLLGEMQHHFITFFSPQFKAQLTLFGGKGGKFMRLSLIQCDRIQLFERYCISAHTLCARSDIER